MIQLSSPKTVQELLVKYHLAPNKKFGQNFLFDKTALERIACCVEPEQKNILEIGPGLGALTQQIALRAKKVVSVEIDSGFLQVLDETLADLDNVTIVHADFLKINLSEIHDFFDGEAFSVCANLPYYITTPILMKLLESNLPWEKMSLLMQSEVAERMAAQPNSKSYGSLSLAVQYYANVHREFTIPPSCFLPKPKVESLVISLTPKTKRLDEHSEKSLFALMHASFAMRRKTLLNNIMPLFPQSNKADLQTILISLGFPAAVRAEALSLDDFIKLNEALS